MSIESEILRIQRNISDAYAAVATKGGELPPLPTSANLAAAVASVPQGGGASVPPGSIVIWSGAVNAVPDGWALCDGENGTPDLRGRFVYGAGAHTDRLVFTSTSHWQHGKRSEMTVATVKAVERLTIGYLVSSEKGYDKFFVYRGDNIVVNGVSGENISGDVAIDDIPIGTTLRFVYSKDASGNNFDDQASFWLTVDGRDIASAEKFGEVFQITAEGEFSFSSEVASQSPYPIRGEKGGSTTAPNLVRNHEHYISVTTAADGERKSGTLATVFEGGASFSSDNVAFSGGTEIVPAGTPSHLVKADYISSNSTNDTTIPIMPPYYALAYIMKL